MPRKQFDAFTRLDASDVNLYLSNETTMRFLTGATHTVATSDRYKILEFDRATAQTVTFSTATAFEPGERVDIIREGAGVVTINRSGTAVTLAGRGVAGTAYRIGNRYDAVSVVCVGTNSYRIIGNATEV
jgi:urease beta subunit